MKIVFNPFFNNIPYINENEPLIGTRVCGPDQLLEELELRAGLFIPEVSTIKRIILYRQALSKALKDNSNLFYKESLETDDFMTAKVLLEWRDSIKMLGWDKSMVCGEKLEGLAAAENYFDCASTPERWQRILNVAASENILSNSDEIEVTVPKKYLEKLYVQLLDSLEKKGVKVSYDSEECKTPDCKELAFKSEAEAYSYVSNLDLSRDSVAVGFDTGLLNDYLHRAGKPAIAVAERGIGSIMSVFYLGLSLFSKPVDVKTLLAYLQLHSTPLNQLRVKVERKDAEPYFRALNKCLADVLVKDGGMGENWDAVIKSAIYDTEGKEVSDKFREKVLCFLNMWDKSDSTSGIVTVNKQLLLCFADELGSWAHSKGNPDSDTFGQYRAIKEACDLLKLAVEDKPQQIELAEIKLLASKLCEPVTLSSAPALLGSADIVAGAEHIFSEVKDIYMLCSASDAAALPSLSAFLSKKEIEFLTKSGVLITPDAQINQEYRHSVLKGLNRCKGSLNIISYTKLNGESLQNSSTVSELLYAKNVKAEQTVAGTPTKPCKVIESDKKLVHTVDRDLLDGFSREESYSSITTLIQNPIDYILSYKLQYGEYGAEAMADVDTTKGNLAHKYVERLGAETNNDVDKMIELHNNNYESFIDEIVSSNGLIMLLPENCVEYGNFRVTLKKSVTNLLNIIKSNGLKIVGFEHELRSSDEKVFGSLMAKVDCILMDANGGYYIFDFKWSSSSTYEKKIKSCRDAQLAVYRHVVEKQLGRVVFCGYYQFPRSKMVTPDTNVLKECQNVSIIEREKTGIDHTRIFKQLENSYVFRRLQIKSGLLEEAQGMEIANLEYQNATEKNDLYPLDEDYNNHSLKATSYGNKNITLYGGLK